MPRTHRHTAPWSVAAALALVAAGAGEARAGRLEATLAVTARVPVIFDYAVSAPQAAVSLTAADLAAGVVDLPGAGEVRVRTNSPAGYMLELGLPAAPWLAEVEVRAAGATAHGAPGQVVRIAVPPGGAWETGGETWTRVDLRLHLAPGALPGDRLPPLSLGLAPL